LSNNLYRLFRTSQSNSNNSLTEISNASAKTFTVDIVVLISPLSILPIWEIGISAVNAKTS
jgi:hypothetical protein